MSTPLMPKATAVWLIDNTSLTFEQIAEFCALHPLEVQGIADDEVARGIIGVDPVVSGQLTREEIERCELDPSQRLRLTQEALNLIQAQATHDKKGKKYTPKARRHVKTDAIAWLLKNCPELSDRQVSSLIGTTKNTIDAVRDKTHWNTQNIKAKDPVLLGLCTQSELDRVYKQALKKAAVTDEKHQERISLELDEKLR